MTQATQRATHWADRVAAEVAAAGGPLVISTGISPSGEIHIGNMREVLTADAVYRALRDRGLAPSFNYVADNLDPLRRVYPFLDAAVYEPQVGRPLAAIPCPCGRHASYAEHFLEPFLRALGELRVSVDVVRADALYASGRMTPWVLRALERREQIAAILTESTGKRVTAEWSPFMPRCESCGRLTGTRVTAFSAARATVTWACACGASGEQAIAGGGKLVWRVDWPARWRALGVTVEPFGKDHATRGGSYDTGQRIVREVFDGEPPYPVAYEWISLKGRGDMASSKGNVLTIGHMLEVVPPDALRYLVLREPPAKRIAFDPGLALLRVVDELDDATARGRDERAVELSRAGAFEPVGVPFKHLVVVAQIAGFDAGRAAELLGRDGVRGLSPSALERRMGFARRWLEEFAPEEMRFTVRAELPEAARGLDATRRRFLERLAGRLAGGMDGEAVHATIYDVAREFGEVEPRELFEAIYLALLGKPRGPRAGSFVAWLGAAFCAARFREAAAETGSGSPGGRHP